MQRGSWSSRTPLFGVLAVVLFIIAFAVGGETPDVDSSGQEAIDFYSSNDTSQTIAAILLAYGALFLALFAGTLSSAFRRAGVVESSLPGLVLAGGALMSLGFLIFGGITLTLTDLGTDADPGAAQALNALNSDFFLPLAVGTGIFMLANAVASLRSGLLPRWLGWAALVLGIAAVTPAGFFALLLSGIWIAVAGVMVFRRNTATTGGTAPTPSTPTA